MKVTNTRMKDKIGFFLGITLICLFGCSNRNSEQSLSSINEAEQEVVLPKEGDASKSGGSPTIRKAFERSVDIPETTNHESNDQPLGHFGTCTIQCCYASSGNSYPLDADVDGNEVKRVYFEKGGWVDFDDSEIDDSGVGHGTDEQGKEWEFEGFISEPSSNSSAEEPFKSEETE